MHKEKDEFNKSKTYINKDDCLLFKHIINYVRTRYSHNHIHVSYYDISNKAMSKYLIGIWMVRFSCETWNTRAYLISVQLAGSGHRNYHFECHSVKI